VVDLPLAYLTWKPWLYRLIRRYLAEGCGHIYEDANLWQSELDDNVELDEWVEKYQIVRPLHECTRNLTDMQNGPFWWERCTVLHSWEPDAVAHFDY
jgi:hypothetical protein